MILSRLDTATFLRLAYLAQDDLTTTDIERELFRRLEAFDTDAHQALAETEFSAQELRTLADAMEHPLVDDAEDVAQLLDTIAYSGFSTDSVIALIKAFDAARCDLDALIECDDLQGRITTFINDY